MAHGAVCYFGQLVPIPEFIRSNAWLTFSQESIALTHVKGIERWSYKLFANLNTIVSLLCPFRETSSRPSNKVVSGQK